MSLRRWGDVEPRLPQAFEPLLDEVGQEPLAEFGASRSCKLRADHEELVQGVSRRLELAEVSVRGGQTHRHPEIARNVDALRKADGRSMVALVKRVEERRCE
jgi:hypothetical protein